MEKKQQKEIIRTVYHKDVADFFGSLGLSEEVQRGEIRCSICGEQITLENFRAVSKKSGNLLFCCNQEFCIQKLASEFKIEGT